jgi:hypothetical protein
MKAALAQFAYPIPWCGDAGIVGAGTGHSRYPRGHHPLPAPIPDRFRHMRAEDVGAAGEIRDRPRHAEDAVHRACGELQQVDRVLQHRLVLGREAAGGVGLRLVEPRVDAAGALQLPRPRLHHAFAHGVAGFARRRVGAQLGRRQPRDFEVQVDAFEQRAGDLAAITQDCVGMAAAAT